eukprot:m.139744 g.139744  ORF g.139744 m.139744 type:complete len:198 (-) comp14810_c0_seq3:318-911(-)
MADQQPTAKVLVGVTGSVAAVKLPLLVKLLKEKIVSNKRIDVYIVSTESARHFYDGSCEELKDTKIWTDKHEWDSWKQVGDDVMHIWLRNWADMFVIAPLDANTLGKMAHGLCDNLLTCVARAWPLKKKPLVVCPAMNTNMWEHPSTTENLEKLHSWGIESIPPISKRLACGDVGVGAMEEAAHIVDKIVAKLNEDL